VISQNHGYTIDVEIHDGRYNNVKDWDYAGLIKGFKAEDGKGRGLLELQIAVTRIALR
jgi:pyruvate decarboxylase